MAATLDSSKDVIGFIDMDCFEVQFYQRNGYRNFRGTPCVVADHTGRIVSASHEAKSFGISRSIRLERARNICPRLNVITKPNIWDKPDARTPRHGSWEVFDALKTFCNNFGSNVVLEYASSDGFFVNLTNEVEIRMKNNVFVEIDKNVFIEGHHLSKTKVYRFYQDRNDWKILKLLYGASLISEMAAYLVGATEIECSGGVSNNKLVAKMACQLHKPAAITVLPVIGFHLVRDRISFSEIPGFGRSSNNGDRVRKMLSVENLEELSKISFDRLEGLLPLNLALKLHNGARGICTEKVAIKDVHNRVTSGKTFHGRNALMNTDRLLNNLRNRAGEMLERLREEKNRHNRVTSSLQIQFEFKDGEGKLTKRNRTFQISADQLTQDDITYRAYQEILNSRPQISFKPTANITRLTLQATWKPPPAVPVPVAQARSICPDMATPKHQGEKIYQLRVSLNDTNPIIWRRIQVPENFTFYKLHKAIQDSVGWEWSTHHEFEIGLRNGRDGRNQWITIGVPGHSFLDRHQIYPEKETQMTDFLTSVGDKIIYQHGPDQEWPHTIVVEEILPATSGISYPACIAGARAAPPEFDCDRCAFNELQEAFNDPAEIRELHKQGIYLNYDPAKFKPDEVFFSNTENSSEDED